MVHSIYHIGVSQNGQPGKGKQSGAARAATKPQSVMTNVVGNRNKEPVASGASKVGRNQQCPCGSGKKYKRCHGA